MIVTTLPAPDPAKEATIELSDLSTLAARPLSVPLGPGPEPAELLRRLAADPALTCLWGGWANGSVLVFTGQPLAVASDQAALDVQPVVAPEPGIVGGGWVGVIGYDVAPVLRFYDHLWRLRAGQWSFEALWSAPRANELAAARARWPFAADDVAPSAWSVGRFGGPPAAAHLANVERAIGSIRAGELYQANICTRLEAPFSGSPAALFADLAGRLHPAYGALVAGSTSVVSMSPELFLRRRGRSVVTSPIKGTRPRGVAGNDERLRGSVKDRAENVMIVDLMRNDLGRVGETGTVRASALLDVQAHPGVWHLVSTVSGQLRADVTDTQLLAATFPPGSVTGAPKIAAMAAISAIEPRARGNYTGAIGFSSPSWGTELNVAIRTFEITGPTIELGVGGGITVDSVPMAEWRECLDKAAPLLAGLGSGLTVATPAVDATAEQLAGGCLETMLALDGRVLRLADHLARLDRSVRELYGWGLPEELALRVRRAATGPGRQVVRVVATADAVTITADVAGRPPAVSDACTVRREIGLWRHKWADRAPLAAVEASVGPAVPLFVAGDDTVLETSRGNVFLLMPDGALRTPPLRDDLLPGVTRRALLDHAIDTATPVQLQPFTVDDMMEARACFWTSSLSGLVPIRSVDDVPLATDSGALAGFSAALVAKSEMLR